MKTTALLTIFAAMAALDAHAGSGKATVPPVTPPADPLFTGSLSVGYDTEYYFRGLWFSSNNVWGGLNLSIPLADKLSLGLGGLYTYSADTDVDGTNVDYSEMDLIASLNYDAGFARFGLVFTNYSFFDTFSGSTSDGTFGFPEAPDSTIEDAQDLGLTVAVPVGSATIYLGGYWDFKIDAPYFELGADYTFAITESFSLVPSVTVGYGDNYYSYPELDLDKSGLTAVLVRLAAPYKLTDSFTITPYIAANLSQETRAGINTARGENDLFGGVSMSYAF